ncbi:MAG: response regulator transcription factor [Lachnospiraceae bacterium]|nr:response regulator transcription factor [Lachnospiraceae bacterium]MBQ2100826.1 response regulator transcription factor [Lachnospiraceae bacterium]MBQ3905319.1 response regulator transcription factor [Lachnospiraceae bacterium]
MYRVLLVDDENMLLDSLEIILSMNDMEIIGKAHDGREALDILREKSQCDIAFVDLNMKGMGGIELIGYVKKMYPKIKILVLTTFYDDKNITDAISNGADGYLLKDSGKDAILGAAAQLMNGVSVLDPKVMLRLTTLMNKNKTVDLCEEMTEREREIATLLAKGLTNRQIADKLYISEGTVKNYISSIYDKTGIHDRVKLVVALSGNL